MTFRSAPAEYVAVLKQLPVSQTVEKPAVGLNLISVQHVKRRNNIMTHEEVRNKLRTQYQGKIWWKHELGDHGARFTPKNVFSAWTVSGPPHDGQKPCVTIYLLEMTDYQGTECGFDILKPIDDTHLLDETFKTLDKLVNKS